MILERSGFVDLANSFRRVSGRFDWVKTPLSSTEATFRQEEGPMFDRIAFASAILGGRACIRGMRIPVSVIVGQIAHGASFDEILEGYPDLEHEDIQQAIEYAAWLTHEQVHTS